jgi:hypothetical protein
MSPVTVERAPAPPPLRAPGRALLVVAVAAAAGVVLLGATGSNEGGGGSPAAQRCDHAQHPAGPPEEGDVPMLLAAERPR